jgi:hypothetical protein
MTRGQLEEEQDKNKKCLLALPVETIDITSSCECLEWWRKGAEREMKDERKPGDC